MRTIDEKKRAYIDEEYVKVPFVFHDADVERAFERGAKWARAQICDVLYKIDVLDADWITREILNLGE